jgi:hypothetical protein
MLLQIKLSVLYGETSRLNGMLDPSAKLTAGPVLKASKLETIYRIRVINSVVFVLFSLQGSRHRGDDLVMDHHGVHFVADG